MRTATARSTELYLVHSQFVNTMTQKPNVVQLLPVEAQASSGLQEHWDYIYEPIGGARSSTAC